MPSEIKRTVALDSERCLGSTAEGRCWSPKEGGSDYCYVHNNSVAKERLRNYRLTKFRQRVNEFADSDVIKSLREEIGIMRLLLEEIINQCKDTVDLLLYSSKIADLTTRIEHLVVSCHKIETNLGFTMDKATVLNLSSQIINIIAKHVSDEKIITNVIDEISAMIEGETNN